MQIVEIQDDQHKANEDLKFELFLLTIIPMILFVLADILKHEILGISLALATGVTIGLWAWLKHDHIDPLLIIGFLVTFGMGVASIKMRNSTFFKLAPVLNSAILTVVILGFAIFDEPIFVRMSDLLESLSPAETRDVIATPQFQEKLATLSHFFLFLIPLHGAAVYLSAVRFSSFIWMLSRISFFPVSFIIMILTFSS